MTNLSDLKAYIQQVAIEKQQQANDEASLQDALKEAQRVRDQQMDRLIKCAALVKEIFEEANAMIHSSSKILRAKHSKVDERREIDKIQLLLTLNKDYVQDAGGGAGTYTNYTCIWVVLEQKSLSLICAVVTGSIPSADVFNWLSRPSDYHQAKIVFQQFLDKTEGSTIEKVLTTLIIDLLKDIEKQPEVQWYH